jgi:hypothetical protein
MRTTRSNTMRRLAVIALTAVGLFGSACGGGERADEPPVPNTLTQAEREAGWRLLFDGATTAGWRGYNADSFPAQGWEVRDGSLVTVEGGGGGDIVTEEEFGDFELSLEFKITPGANSGIFFGAIDQPGKPMWASAPEYQILDDSAYVADGTDMTRHLTGQNYDLHASSEKALKPVGEWNVARIVVRRPHVEHWLNGVKMVEYELGSPEWEALVAASKFSVYPEYGRATSGHIGLQDHGTEVSFRNIKLRPLGP